MSSLYVALLMSLSVTSQAAPQKRFSGGTDVLTNAFPWVGSFQQQDAHGGWNHACGMVAGTNVAVTAAQCFNLSGAVDYRLVFDANDLSALGGATISNISSVLIDAGFSTNGPGYTSDNIELRTTSAVTANPLPSIGLALDSAGLECEIFGWGFLDDGTFDPILKTRNVTLISRADCQARVSALGATITSVDTCVEGDVISQGDAGNPLLCSGQIVGVASWTSAGEGCESPVSVFTASVGFFVG